MSTTNFKNKNFNETSIYNVLLLGDAKIGKTKWVKQLTGHSYDNRYIPTVGAQIYSYQMDGYIFNIWDVAGNEFSGIRKHYYEIADAAIVMHNNTEESLRWRNEIKNVPQIIVNCNLSDASKTTKIEFFFTTLRNKLNNREKNREKNKLIKGYFLCI